MHKPSKKIEDAMMAIRRIMAMAELSGLVCLSDHSDPDPMATSLISMTQDVDFLKLATSLTQLAEVGRKPDNIVEVEVDGHDA